MVETFSVNNNYFIHVQQYFAIVRIECLEIPLPASICFAATSILLLLQSNEAQSDLTSISTESPSPVADQL